MDAVNANIPGPYEYKGLFRRYWESRSFMQRRLMRMCMSMLVMAICFPLYELGLFGSVDGPLNPDRLGDKIATLGVTRDHSMIFFLSLLIFALSATC